MVQKNLSKTFKDFFDSEKSSGIFLVICAAISLLLANSIVGANYSSIWHFPVAGMSVEHWINDGLMAIFFLLFGKSAESGSDMEAMDFQIDD